MGFRRRLPVMRGPASSLHPSFVRLAPPTSVFICVHLWFHFPGNG
jgi:hypothetical protein